LQVAGTGRKIKLKTIVRQPLTGVFYNRYARMEKIMSALAAFILSAIILLLFGIAGILGGLVWKHRGYHLPRSVWAGGIGLLLFGIWLIVSQADQLAQWGAVRTWPSTNGVVVASRVAGERAYHPEIVYQYAVNGTTYKDSTSFDTPSFGGRSVKREVAETIVAKFPPGTTVAVHYDPNHPTRSLLRISPDWSLYGKIGLGGTLVGLGLFLIFGRRRSRG
jgi:hypothetical protein